MDIDLIWRQTRKFVAFAEKYEPFLEELLQRESTQQPGGQPAAAARTGDISARLSRLEAFMDRYEPILGQLVHEGEEGPAADSTEDAAKGSGGAAGAMIEERQPATDKSEPKQAQMPGAAPASEPAAMIGSAENDRKESKPAAGVQMPPSE